MDRLQIDNTKPFGCAQLTEQRDSLMLHHGGTITRIEFDKVELMDIPEFLHTEVGKMQQNLENKEMYLIRDSLNQAVCVIYGDRVVRYHTLSVEDIPLNMYAKLVQPTEERAFVPNITYPIISYIENKAGYKVTIYREAAPFTYKAASDTFSGYPDFTETIYAPPIWFRVDMTKARSATAAYIAVPQGRCTDAMNTELGMWPLPNVHPNGQVCLGYSEVQTTLTDEQRTLGMVIQLTLDQILNSNWNADLTWNFDYSKMLGKAYDQVKPAIKAKYDKIIEKNRGDSNTANLLRTLAIMSEPGGWLKINYQPLSIPRDNGVKKPISAKEFTCGNL